MPSAPERLSNGILFYDCAVLDSTNSMALKMVSEGALDAVAVLARVQKAGRGRQGRVWAAPLGNLNLSLIWADHPELGGLWSLLSGIIVIESLEQIFPGLSCRLKWPNDIMVGDAKIGGILIERRDLSGPLVIGIGVNIIAAPPITDRKVASIRDCLVSGDGIADADARMLAMVILDNFTVWRQNRSNLEMLKKHILADWQARAWGIGREASWSAGQVRITGTARGLDHDGAFVIVDATGHHHRVIAGEVGFDVADH